MSQVHIAITRQVKPGMEQAFEAALRDFAKRSLHVNGVTGVHLIGPAPGGDDRDYGILRSFESDAAREAFYSSPTYLDWEQQVAPMVEGRPRYRQLNGLEAFFCDLGMVPPPRWKMAVVTWLAVFPSVWLWSSVLPALLGGTHPIVRMAIVDAFVVATLAWVAMPMLTRLFARWLHPKKMH